MQEIAASMVDVVYPLAGDGLPRDHRQALADALVRLLPWLAGHPEAGVHRINVVAGADSPADQRPPPNQRPDTPNPTAQASANRCDHPVSGRDTSGCAP